MSLSPLSNLVIGVYSFELEVKDYQGRIAKDTVRYDVIQDTLGGKEFNYNDTWLVYHDGGYDEIYVQVFDSANFYNTTRIIDVSLQLNGSSNWINVPRWEWYYDPVVPNQTGFYSMFGSPGHDTFLLIENYSSDSTLIGKPVKVKVKFG
jgi:hypothetical protein